VLPDFFIGAHAAVSGYALVSRDKGRFSTYFPSVELIIPESTNDLIDVNLREAELLFQAGALSVPVIKKHNQSEGWTVTLDGKHKLNPALETARGQVRVFKRLDAAVGVLFEIGFDEVKVVH